MPHIPGWAFVFPKGVRETEEEQAAAKRAKASVVVSLHARREAGFFVRCIISMQALLTSLSFVSFTLFIDGLWDRVEFQLALIFGLVALRFSAGNAIPVVPYLTTLDTYQNACIIMLVLLALVQGCIFGALRRHLEESVAVGITMEHEQMFNRIDFSLASGGFVLWLLFNFFFFWRTRRRMGNQVELAPQSGADGLEEINWTGPYSEQDHKPPWSKANAPDGPPRFLRGGSSMAGNQEAVADEVTAADASQEASRAEGELAPRAKPVRLNPGRSTNGPVSLERLAPVHAPASAQKAGLAQVAPAPTD
jgi:hypothetical protein